MEQAVLISHDDARAVDGLSRSSRERLVDANLYPPPVRLTAGRIAFVREEVEQWARDRIAARDQRRDPASDPVLVATAGRRGLSGIAA